MSIWYALCDATHLEFLRMTFMKNALLAVFILAPLFGLLSTMIVTGRMSFFSDALGHSGFTGIAIGVLCGSLQPTVWAVALAAAFALLFSFVRSRSRQSADTIIGVFSSTAVALGIFIATLGGNSFTKSAFTGNSGVGKSSILNALDPAFQLKTGEISTALGRGRHTTRHVELFRLSCGAEIMDSPGFSSFETEELNLELDAQHVDLTYFNYLEDDPIVIADAEQIKRVINNIVSNSIKYMDKSHKVINIRLRDVGDFVQVEIEDNGKGIATKDLTKIFDRFYRTDASRNSTRGGSGIGLSIVKKILEDHGGKVWATSKEGVGTTMYFVLRKYQEVPVS